MTSGLLHDYIVAMSFRVFSYGWILGMLVQVIFVKVGTVIGKHLGIENSTYCNWFTWFNILTAMTGWSVGFYLQLNGTGKHK